jgi:hypothetical protein
MGRSKGWYFLQKSTARITNIREDLTAMGIYPIAHSDHIGNVFLSCYGWLLENITKEMI